jgi:hypothetical protein
MKNLLSLIFYPFKKIKDYFMFKKHMKNLKKKDPYLYR